MDTQPARGVGLGEGDFVIVEGTLAPIDRIKANEPYYSMKSRGTA
jgi:hypothetical protein